MKRLYPSCINSFAQVPSLVSYTQQEETTESLKSKDVVKVPAQTFFSNLAAAALLLVLMVFAGMSQAFGQTNVAIGKTATATSVNSTYPASNAVDGNTTTRWQSLDNNTVSFTVDLGETYNISQVQLLWESNNYGVDFAVQVSNDNVNWTVMRTAENNGSATNNYTGLNFSGRYVRVNGTAKRASFLFQTYYYSLQEFQVYGTPVYSYISQHYSIYSLKNGTELAKATLNTGQISSATIATGANPLPDFLTLNANGNITVNNNPVTVGTYSTTVRFNGSTNLTAGVQININDDVFQVNNEAFKLGDNNYRLTEASANKRGEVWRTTPVDLSKSFEISFKANLGTADGGADGIAFALQRHGSNPLFAYGATGEGLGVGHGSSTTNPRSGGISPSVVVEFDTWQNTEVNNAAIEPNYDHLAIFLSGEERTPVREIEGNATSPWTVKPMKGTASAPVNVEDGVDHLVRIIWDKDTKKMSVYFDNSLRTSYTADLVKTVFGDDPIVYFGYSASTGSSVNQHIVSEINFTPLDIDGDGIANSTDMDSDNDGISNTAESGGADPFADHNADDLANYKDPVYAASVGSSLNSKGVVASMDKDGDGIINVLDLDSDNDGLPDAVEANNGNLPDNMQANGQYPASFVTGTTDVNRNGMVDAVQSNALPNGDKDGDGIPNALDLDSDGDGIVDAIEANNGVLPSSMTSVGQYSVAYMFQNDHNWDGISDIVASTPLANGDFDQDGLMNFLDIDADSDGLPDNLEAQAKDGMLAAKKADLNQNGIDDAFDANATGGKALVPVNSGGIESPDFLDLDSDGDSFLDFVEAFDKNKDGKSSDDFLQLAADFRTRSGNSSMYTATKEANGYPAWMAYASDKRLNFLSPKSAIYYRDSDADGLVDLMDTQSYGEEPTGSSVNYAFRSSDLNTPLPVELISFKATPKGSNVALTWATASEKDNDYFLVERSLDGRTFTSVGKVAGNGTTNVMQNYNFMTASAPAGTVYYRLKQVDYNGKSEYSKVISVKAQGAIARAFLAAYPNPTLGKVVLVSADLPAGTATVTLLHVNGRVVFQKQVEVNAGDIELDLAGQAAGVYCIQVQTAAGKGVVRVVKQ